MNDLTSVLLGPESNISLDESLKQSRTFDFESGTTQTIGNKSVPTLIIDLSYRNISQAEYEAIEGVYQQNHSNTFLVDFGDYLDPRIILNRKNNGVFAFAEFKFSTSIQQMNGSEKRYSGKVTLITSVIFNYTQFQDIFNQPSSYNPNVTTNIDFVTILSSVNPQKVDYGYRLNKKFSNLGKSVSTQIDLDGNKKTWRLQFLCEETEWIELITFFRKKGGIQLFGMPLEGYYFSSMQILINARFEQDSFKHQKIIGGVYQVQFDIIEVK